MAIDHSRTIEAKMGQNRSNAIFAYSDIMSVLMAAWVFISSNLSPTDMSREDYTQITMEEKTVNQSVTLTPGATDLFLTIAKDDVLVFEGGSLNKPQTVKSPAQAVERLKTIMPAKLFLRADRLVGFGTVHKVLNASAAMGIPVAFAAKLS
jgi:biopolymer transport protein ExbD